MATQAAMSERINLKLSAVAAEIENLRAIEEDWQHMPEDHQAAFLLEWDELMARVESLDNAFHSSQMTPKQEALFRALLNEFELAASTIATLGLVRPHIKQVL